MNLILEAKILVKNFVYLTNGFIGKFKKKKQIIGRSGLK